jgi:hypothetical protein
MNGPWYQWLEFRVLVLWLSVIRARLFNLLILRGAASRFGTFGGISILTCKPTHNVL